MMQIEITIANNTNAEIANTVFLLDILLTLKHDVLINTFHDRILFPWLKQYDAKKSGRSYNPVEKLIQRHSVRIEDFE